MSWKEEWISEFKEKHILIWGFGREGKSSYRLIRELLPEQQIDIAEGRASGVKILEDAKLHTVHTSCRFDDEIDIPSYDIVLKSPGIVLPKGMDKQNISGETQLFLKHYRDQVIGITGTKGKSTTTSLIGRILSEQYHVHIVGNIGVPCFDIIPQLQKEDLVSFELSCHQLEYCPYSPHTAIFLNLFEEHLDHYGSYEAYGNAKANIFRHQIPGDTAILNEALTAYVKEADHPILIGKDIKADGHTLIIPDETITVKDCALVGEHNYLNLAVAYYVCHTLYSITDQQFLDAAAAFHPLAHRLQDLGIYGGIRWIDDSISTIGQSCIQALTSLKDVDTVLVGGMDRGIEYEELEQYLHRRSDVNVIFMYSSGKRVHEEMKQQNLERPGLYDTENLEEAVALARTLTHQGHLCLLSPAASSYDHFKNFEERGEVFEALAKQA